MDPDPPGMTFAVSTMLDQRFLARMDRDAEVVELWQQITGVGFLRGGLGGVGQGATGPSGVSARAETGAEALLYGRLSPVDAAVWRQTARLMRPSRVWPGIEYLLQRDGPVKVIDRGDVKQSLCVVAAQGEPESDRIMTILDVIESDERRLWEMAVATPGPSHRDGWPGLIVPAPPTRVMPGGTEPLVRLSPVVGSGAGIGLFFFIWALFL